MQLERITQTLIKSVLLLLLPSWRSTVVTSAFAKTKPFKFVDVSLQVSFPGVFEISHGCDVTLKSVTSKSIWVRLTTN